MPGVTTASPLSATRVLSTSGRSSDRDHEGRPIVDGYDVLRSIGQGGMGVVFEAVQQATGRRVAIKFLPDSGIDSAAARQRFEREVQVVARLQHPGIVPVLDSGVRRGQYYYVMDYVEGKPLDQALVPGIVSKTQAIEAVIAICESVDYAHQRGVLHRDLKPSNVLVDSRGRPHLLDFGVAKVMGDDDESRGMTVAGAGQLLGTIAYMSPEQAAGNAAEASVRSDVYSLGVILYQLLTGELPVPMQGSLREVLTRIAEVDPPAPSTRVRSISKDIDAVICKALEKQPDRRYATAGEFAADLRRALSDEPVTARRIGSAGRLIRWTKRNKAVSATIGAAVVTLGVVSTTLIIRVVEERDRANANAAENLLNFERAQAALESSQRNEAQARENFALLRNILEAYDYEQGEPTVRELFSMATLRLDRSPPKTPITEANVREIFGIVQRRLGQYESSKANLERALVIREREGSDPQALAETLHNLAATLWWQSDFSRAEPYYVRALELRRSIADGPSPDVAFSLTHLAACRLSMGNVQSAQQLAEEALAMRRRLFGEKHEQVAGSLNNVAKTLLEQEDFAGAESYFRQALAMIRELRGDQHIGTASASHNLGTCLLEKGDARSAIEALNQAVAIRRELYPSGHHQLASSLSALSRAQLLAGEVDAAQQSAEEAIAMLQRTAAPGRLDTADAAGALGAVRLAQGRPQEARELLASAMHDYERLLTPPPLTLTLLELDAARAAAQTGDLPGARVLAERAVERISRARGEQSPFTRKAREVLAQLPALNSAG